jgi:Rrf2 family protein
MPFISTGVEYALHCLLFLIAPSGGSEEANVRDLALLQGVSVEYLAKLFTKLSKAGLVVATEGARGGFALSRPPQEITFQDVVVAIDGQKPLFACREIRARCAVFGSEAPTWATSGVCSIHQVMLAAETRMRDELASHSLASLAGQVATKAPPGFGVQIATWIDNRKSNAIRSKE